MVVCVLCVGNRPSTLLGRGGAPQIPGCTPCSLRFCFSVLWSHQKVRRPAIVLRWCFLPRAFHRIAIMLCAVSQRRTSVHGLMTPVLQLATMNIWTDLISEEALSGFEAREQRRHRGDEDIRVCKMTDVAWSRSSQFGSSAFLESLQSVKAVCRFDTAGSVPTLAAQLLLLVANGIC